MLVQQLIISVFSHRPESACPVLSWLFSRPDDDLVIQRFQLDLFSEIAALQKEFRNSDPLRITDSYNFGLHRHIVITGWMRSQAGVAFARARDLRSHC